MSDEQKTYIMIRWHALRRYQHPITLPDVVGLRGYPVTDGSEIYELEPNEAGEWECTYRYAVLDDGIGSEARWKIIAKDKDLYKVIQAAEEHAYKHSEQAEIDEALRYEQDHD